MSKSTESKGNSPSKIEQSSIGGSSSSSADEIPQLILSESVYKQSDNDWTVREALIFR